MSQVILIINCCSRNKLLSLLSKGIENKKICFKTRQENNSSKNVTVEKEQKHKIQQHMINKAGCDGSSNKSRINVIVMLDHENQTRNIRYYNYNKHHECYYI